MINLNWSSISAFKYDKNNWYNTYILNIKTSSPEMEFGILIDKKIQNDPTFLPYIPRYEEMQYSFKDVPFDDNFNLKGTPDGINFSTTPKILADYKTGRISWTKLKTKRHGQLLMYLLLIYLTKQIPPEEFICRIHWLPTKKDENNIVSFDTDKEFQTFECKHTLEEVLNFGIYIKEIYQKMQEYLTERKKHFPLL